MSSASYHQGSLPTSGQPALDDDKGCMKLRDTTGKEVPKSLSLKAFFLGLVHASYLLQHKASVITQLHLSPQLLDLSCCPMHMEGTVAVAGSLPL